MIVSTHFNPNGWHIQLHTVNYFFVMFSPSGQKLVNIIHFLKCFRWTLKQWIEKAKPVSLRPFCWGPGEAAKKTKTAWLQLGCPISLRSSERALGKRRSFTAEMFFCHQYWDTVIDGSKILNNHQGCMKACKWWDKLPTSTGAGFFKSIVWLLKDFLLHGW